MLAKPAKRVRQRSQKSEAGCETFGTELGEHGKLKGVEATIRH
jgi:hypothetical protein